MLMMIARKCFMDKYLWAQNVMNMDNIILNSMNQNKSSPKATSRAFKIKYLTEIIEPALK
jgi:hypothetical protein